MRADRSEVRRRGRYVPKRLFLLENFFQFVEDTVQVGFVQTLEG